MPSRSFYLRTTDGYLEKNEQKEGIAAAPFQPTNTKPIQNGFTMDMEEHDLWLKSEDTSEVLLSDMNSFATQPIEATSDNMLLNNALLEQSDTLSISALHNLYSGDLSSAAQDLNQDRVRRSYRSRSLSLSKIRVLQDIAMPYYALSSATRAKEVESCYSLEPETETPTKKRKLPTSNEGAEAGMICQTRKQQGHNTIQERYRSSLKGKIYALQQRIPSLRTISDGEQASTHAEQGNVSIPEAVQKFGKAEVLMGAVAYISHLEGTVERLGSEVVTLKTRIMAFEKLAMSGSVVMSNGVGSRALVKKTLQTVKADFDYTNIGEIKKTTKQLRA